MKSLLFTRRSLGVGGLALFVLSPILAQNIRYVKQNASGNGDGSSWANAFIRFQQALAVAQDGDEIWIAKGTYKPTTTNDRYARYDLPSGVAVYGGFTGTETQREQRDWTANLTILSGDIGVPGDSTDNSFNVLYAYGSNERTRLDGLVFEEGNATNTDINVPYHRPTCSGGGIYLDGEGFGYAQLSVVNCTIRRNRALYQGGGIYANGREGGMAIVRLEHCLFERNNSKTFGGGFSLENYFEQPFALEVKDCEFRENYTVSGGIAIWLRANQSVTFSECKFFNNRTIWGQTIFMGEMEQNYPVNFSNCLFSKNADYMIWYSPNFNASNNSKFLFKSCVFSENGIPVIYANLYNTDENRANFEHCVFNSNKQVGGSLSYVVQMSGANFGESYFTNCLFYNNEDHEILIGGQTSIENCIIIDKPNEIYTNTFSGIATYKVSNTLFRLPNCTSLGGFNTTVICGPNNFFGLDPLFVNPSASDFHLQPCSPAINAGNNAILDSLGISTDLDGNPRIRNGVVDMGPYETTVSLHPSVAAEPVCAGASDGSIVFSPDICPPYDFEWSNGTTTGNNTEGLSAGTYVFTATGSNNISVSDTIVITDPGPVEVSTKVEDVRCFGEPGGYVETMTSGGTAPYAYMWAPPLPPVPAHYSMPAGSYFVTVTDANGCTGTAQASIGSPDPLQFFYTIHPVSCMACSDGSVVFDSVIGGTNPPLPAPLYNLSAGVYSFTLTDAVGCPVAINFTINVMIGTKEESIEGKLKLSPNPTVSGESALLEWLGNEPATLRVLDLQGRILEEKRVGQNGSVMLVAQWPSGIYQVEIQTVTGKRALRRWAIF